MKITYMAFAVSAYSDRSDFRIIRNEVGDVWDTMEELADVFHADRRMDRTLIATNIYRIFSCKAG
jgi:hypothetical protein